MVRAHGAEYAFFLERAQELERERGWIVGLELDHVRRHLTHDGVKFRRVGIVRHFLVQICFCLLYTSPSPRD